MCDQPEKSNPYGKSEAILLFACSTQNDARAQVNVVQTTPPADFDLPTAVNTKERYFQFVLSTTALAVPLQ